MDKSLLGLHVWTATYEIRQLVFYHFHIGLSYGLIGLTVTNIQFLNSTITILSLKYPFRKSHLNSYNSNFIASSFFFFLFLSNLFYCVSKWLWFFRPTNETPISLSVTNTDMMCSWVLEVKILVMILRVIWIALCVIKVLTLQAFKGRRNFHRTSQSYWKFNDFDNCII